MLYEQSNNEALQVLLRSEGSRRWRLTTKTYECGRCLHTLRLLDCFFDYEAVKLAVAGSITWHTFVLAIPIFAVVVTLVLVYHVFLVSDIGECYIKR